jgi:hypothetical protein
VGRPPARVRVWVRCHVLAAPAELTAGPGCGTPCISGCGEDARTGINGSIAAHSASLISKRGHLHDLRSSTTAPTRAGAARRTAGAIGRAGRAVAEPPHPQRPRPTTGRR